MAQAMLEGQVVVITGSAGGIGRYAAKTFAEAGARVVVADVKPLDTIAAELLAETAEPERVEQYIAAAHELGESYGRDTAVLAAERAEATLDLRADRPADAVGRLEVTLERARQIGQPYEIARTARLAGKAYRARGSDGDDIRSKARLEEARAIFERLGAEPDANLVRTMLEQPLPA